MKKLIFLISSFLLISAQAAQFTNPTVHRVFVDEKKPRTLIVVPASAASPISESRQYYVSESECQQYNSLDYFDLEAGTGLDSIASHLDINSTPTEIEAARTEFNRRLATLKGTSAQRLSQSKFIGGKVSVTYDFGIASDIKLIRAANPTWSVEIADFTVTNTQLFFAIPDGIPQTESDFERLPYVLNYSAGIFSAEELLSGNLVSNKKMKIRNGKLNAEFIISKRGACVDMQSPNDEKKPKIQFGMSLHQDAYYCAFPALERSSLMQADLKGKCE